MSKGDEHWFTFMLVEYTQKKIIIPSKKVGDTVNVEVDVLGKYSERAWEAFVPKIDALEQKVKDLESKISSLEESGGNGSSSATAESQGDRGKEVGSFDKLDTWDRAKQSFSDGAARNPDNENRASTDKEWVR